MLRLFLLSVVCCVAVSGHEYYPGQCPNFTPMSGFDWAQFSTGIWFVTHKFATKSSCLTYEFKTDELGFKSIEQIYVQRIQPDYSLKIASPCASGLCLAEGGQLASSKFKYPIQPNYQVRQLPYTERIGLDHEYIYTGKLYTPQESSPAKMIVRFPLNVVGSSSFTVMDTDYDNHAMVCTCQDVDLFFSYVHRRSCSILQRAQEDDPEITKKMIELLDSRTEDASHDFDKIKQAGCDYNKEKVLNIDVDKILGLKGDSGLRDVVESVASEFEFNQKTVEDIKEEAKDIVKK